MKYIDEKFKEVSPSKTVERIREILSSVGIETECILNNSDVENCHSVRVRNVCGFPGTNGKGITEEFCLASGYGEFMERLQSGLFLYKYQGSQWESEMCLHNYAPDKKYMTRAELEQNGEWMDDIIKTYPSLSRRKIAALAELYDFGGEKDKILTVPYYSLFEDKYVYLPVGFVEYIYSANGCCVGNSRSEAFVHAMSEMIERNRNIKVLVSGKKAPEISRDILYSFPVVAKILDRIEKENRFTVNIFDYSLGCGIPVIGTRIIDRKDHSYIVNVGADPVLEIAIERTLTELFQGRNIRDFSAVASHRILKNLGDVNPVYNVLNQLENGCGEYAAESFTDSDIITDKKDIPDRSDGANTDLAGILLDFYRNNGNRVYVRNYSFLGFDCYKFVVPGFSESRGLRLTEPVQEYYFAEKAAKTLRNIEAASDEDLTDLLMFANMISPSNSRCNNYSYLSGVMLDEVYTLFGTFIHFAYAAYRLGNTEKLEHFLRYSAETAYNEADADYCNCLSRYFTFKYGGISDGDAFCILKKFYCPDTVKRLEDNVKSGNCFAGMLVKCDLKSCKTCNHRDICHHAAMLDIQKKVGAVYSTFINGQDRENFKIGL